MIDLTQEHFTIRIYLFLAPAVPPESVHIGIINSTTAFVKWLPPPSQYLNGILQGYKVRFKFYFKIIFLF